MGKGEPSFFFGPFFWAMPKERTGSSQKEEQEIYDGLLLLNNFNVNSNALENGKWGVARLKTGHSNPRRPRQSRAGAEDQQQSSASCYR